MTEFHGATASGGLARGRVRELGTRHAVAAYAPGTISEERTRLADAISCAGDELKALIGGLDGQAAQIIGFQLELLDDADFAAAAFDALKRGESAHRAWTSAVEKEIADYRSGEDEYLSARADDLIDLKHRVERALLASGNSSDLRSGIDESAGEDIVLVADLLSPSRFLELDLSRIQGIATVRGSPASHVSILARTRGVPMIVGCGPELLAIGPEADALLDADRGVLITGASAEETDVFARRVDRRDAPAGPAEAAARQPALTASGERVRVYANLDDPGLLAHLDIHRFDGIGLVRTEFLFSDGAFPTEDEQYEAYRRFLRWAAGRPVTIRILDAGGDKPVPGLTLAEETNPFLGVRGIRLFRHHPDIFRTQLRALLRATVHGELRIMAPMVSIPQEMAELRAEMNAQIASLRRAGFDCIEPRLGMMVEVPSAALTATEFETDFYSIGTNDLVQYTFAAARDEYRLGHLLQGGPAVLLLIRNVVEAGRKKGIDVSICGDLASDPSKVGHLLQAGVRDLSAAPASLAAVKQAVRQWKPEESDQ